EQDSACTLAALTPLLSDRDGPWRKPQTIAAFIDFGPELLYRTHHRILAGPYHRNGSGILAAYRLLTSADLEASRRIVDERQVNLILLCPPRDGYYFERGGEDSVYARLVRGD